MNLWWWVLHIIGSDNLSGPWYGFWSGIAGDTAIFSGLALVAYTQWKRHNCEVHGCWRISRHQVGEHHVCSKHHPEGAPSAEHVAAEYDGND